MYSSASIAPRSSARMDITRCDLLRDCPHVRDDVTAEAGDAHLQPLRSATRLSALRNQPPHCMPVLPHRETNDVVLGKEGVEELVAASVVVPSVLLTWIEHE